MDYEIDQQLGLVMCKPVENFSFEELLEHLQKLLQDSRFYPGMSGLYDFSLVDVVTGDISAFVNTAETASDHSTINEPTPVAIILDRNNKVMKGIFEGYCIMASSSLVDYRIFYNDDIAPALEFTKLTKLPSFFDV